MPLKSRIPEIAVELEAAARKIAHEGADRVAESAVKRVPYDPREPEHIRDAIHVEEASEGFYVVAGNNKVFWGHMVEHGTTHSAPEPFLVPALEENLAQIAAEGAAVLKETVR